MKFRKIISVLIALTMVMAMSVTAFAAVVYDGTADMQATWDKADYPGYQDGYDDPGKGRLVRAGAAATSWSDANGLKVAGLANSWDAVDFLIGGLDGTYTLVVEFTADSSKKFGICGADGNAELATGEGASVKVEYKFTAANGKAGSENRFRLHNLTDRGDYFIKSIVLYDEAGPAAATTTTATSAKTGDNNLVGLAAVALPVACGVLFALRRKKVKAN